MTITAIFPIMIVETCGDIGSGLCAYATSSGGESHLYVLGSLNTETLGTELLLFFKTPPAVEGIQGHESRAPQVALLWANGGDVAKTMSRIAEGVTAFMRQGPASQQLVGTVHG